MKRLFMTTALATVGFATTASAGCDNLSPDSGDTVTCSGTETNELKDGSKDITVNLLPDAVIDTTVSGDDAIKLKDNGNTVNVAATAQVIGGDEAIVLGDGGVVENLGTITAADKGIVGENEAGEKATGLSVYNGINKDGDPATIDTTASITAPADEGIESGDNTLVVNYGVIEGFDDALDVGDNATIFNFGRIENTATAADVVADPDAAQDAIDIDSGIIFNLGSGEIISTTDAAIDFDAGSAGSTIFNEGTIRGTLAINTDGADMQGQVVINSGVLEGTSGTALMLGAGADTLGMIAGGTLIGGADFGEGEDDLILAAGFLLTADLAGGALLDGGLGDDLVLFESYNIADVTVQSAVGEDMLLSIMGFDVNLRSWELFEFADTGPLTAAEFKAQALAPVPLPGGLPLMLAGLGGLAVVRTRRSLRR